MNKKFLISFLLLAFCNISFAVTHYYPKATNTTQFFTEFDVGFGSLNSNFIDKVQELANVENPGKYSTQNKNMPFDFTLGAYSQNSFGLSISYLSLPNKDIETTENHQEVFLLKSNNILVNGIYHRRLNRNTSVDFIFGIQQQYSTIDLPTSTNDFNQKTFSDWGGTHYGVGLQYHWSDALSLQAKILHLNQVNIPISNLGEGIDYSATIALAGVQMLL